MLRRERRGFHKNPAGIVRSLTLPHAPLPENLPGEQIHLKSLALGSGHGGVFDPAQIAPDPQSSSTLLQIASAGLVRVQNGRAAPIEEGLLVADYLALRFSP